MGDWFQPAGQRSSFQASSVVTANAAADTLGLWTEIAASIPFDVAMWNIDIFADPFCFAWDVGVSPDGATWTPLITLPTGRQQSVFEANFHAVPLLLRAGLHLGVRCMAETTGSKAGFPDFNFIAGRTLGSMDAFQRATTYGLTGSKGVAVSTGATQNVGGFTTITASTTNPMKALILALQSDATSYPADALLQFDIGVGGAGSEQTLFNKLYAYGKNGTTYLQVQPSSHGPYPCTIPAGSRISVQAKAPNVAGTYTTRCSVIGFD